MDVNQLKDWLVPVSTCFTLVTVSVGVWRSLKEYRLKLKAEARLNYSTQVETDIRLLTLFTEIMNIAHARGGSAVSEKAIEKMFDKGILKEEDFANLQLLNQKLETVSVLNLPVGLSAQEAAIAAIATLAKRHDVLRAPATEALNSISKWNQASIAGKYLEELNALLRDTDQSS